MIDKELSKAAFSESAKEKIAKAGGQAIVIEKKTTAEK